MTHPRPWTTTDVATVRRLYPHTPTKEVADLLNRTVGAIHFAASKYGIRAQTCKNNRLPKNGELIRQRIHEGVPPQLIAQEIGTSACNLVYRVKVGKWYAKKDYRQLIQNRENFNRLKKERACA